MTRGKAATIDRRLLAGGATLALLAGTGLTISPRLVLLAMMVLVVVTAAWLISGLHHRVEPIVWREYQQPLIDSVQADGRVRLLRARLASASSPLQSSPINQPDRFDPTDAIVEGLVDVIDDHLLSEHGIDRSASPEAAAAILGPDLARFVADPAAARAMARRSALPATLERIEAL